MTMSIMKTKILATCLVLVCSTTDGCGIGWLQFKDKCYLFTNTQASWGTAQIICGAFRSHLAEPKTKSESHCLMNHTDNLGGNFWIGISDIVKEGKWIYTSTQHPVVIHDFHPTNPNSQNISDCVALRHDYQGHWSDEPCHTTFYFICEKENV
ncbi:perlucin-like isoform X2 [Ostrea edulis]|nr:perlucin-like isoform X2 [Ostrea edulis]